MLLCGGKGFVSSAAFVAGGSGVVDDVDADVLGGDDGSSILARATPVPS